MNMPLSNPFVAFVEKFISLSPGEVELFASYCSERKFPAGSVILNEGKICESILFITSGTARSFFMDFTGREFTWNFHFNNGHSKFENYFALDYKSFLTQSPSLLTFEVLSDVIAIELSYDAVGKIYSLGEKFQAIGRIMGENAYGNIHARAFSFLALSAEDRYTELLKSEPYLLQLFPQYYIASYLGVTPPSLSRIRKRIV
jgi:CRP-like cAMP-binding protein